MATATETESLAEREIDVWNGGDVDAIDDIYAADAVYVDPFGEERDRDSLKEYIEMLRTAFPDFHVEVEEHITEGNRITTRYTFSGTHEGEYRGYEPTGNSFELHGMTVSHVEDGRVVKTWNATNALSMAKQLGLLG